MITSPIFIFTTLALSQLYFVVSGIQFWLTAYCVKVIDADPRIVNVAYVICSITAPIPGAATGGFLADKNVSMTLF